MPEATNRPGYGEHDRKDNQMKRLVPAARQLIEQATARSNKSKAGIVGEADGLGFYRSVQFDASTSKWLAPALDVIDDKRIASVDYEGKGRAVVTFVADTRADRRDLFPIEDVDAVLSE